MRTCVSGRARTLDLACHSRAAAPVHSVSTVRAAAGFPSQKHFLPGVQESVPGCVRQVLRLRFRRTSFDLNAVVVLQGRAGWTSGETRDHHETTQFDLNATWLDRCNMQGLRIRQSSSSKRSQAWAIFIRCTLLLLIIDIITHEKVPWDKREKTVSEKAEDEDEAEIPGLQRTTSGGQRRPREEERSMWTARGAVEARLSDLAACVSGKNGREACEG